MNYGQITKAYTAHEVTAEQMTLINTYSRRPLEQDEVFVFSVNLCDNDIDRDFEQFSVSALEALQPLMVGKTGIFDHESKTENQAARIFQTELIQEIGKVTATGAPYVSLKAYAYMLRCAKNLDLILEIDGGIKKEVSISCSIRKTVCSICGADRKSAPCPHQKGKSYPGEQGEQLCYTILDEPADAYEWSFVAVPAQRSAGVTKGFLQPIERSVSMNETVQKALSGAVNFNAEEAASLLGYIKELEGMAEIGKAYHEGLRKEFVKLSTFACPTIDPAIAEETSKKMSAQALLEFNKAFGQQAAEALPVSFQLFSAQPPREGENHQFKI